MGKLQLATGEVAAPGTRHGGEEALGTPAPVAIE